MVLRVCYKYIFKTQTYFLTRRGPAACPLPSTIPSSQPQWTVYYNIIILYIYITKNILHHVVVVVGGVGETVSVKMIHRPIGNITHTRLK